MPLEVLIVLVVGGIAGVTLVLHLLGLSRLAKLDPESAKEAWLRHYPDDTVLAVDLLPDHHAALVSVPQGRGILWVFGADTVARRLDNVRLEETPKGLLLRFADFAAPALKLTLPHDERAFWKERLQP